MELVVALGAFGGLRAGEIAGLQVSDIDFLRRQIRVERQITPDGVQPPKYGSERTVYVPEALTDMLSRHVTPGCSWVFHKGSEPLNQNVISLRFVRLRNKVELTTLRLHDLRHYFASGLIASGCDPVTVARALGHANASMTLAVYSHLWPTAEDRTRQAASGLMSAVLDPPADSPRTGEGG